MRKTILILIFSSLWAVSGFYFGWLVYETVWSAIIFMIIAAMMGWQGTVMAIDSKENVTQGMILNSIVMGGGVLFFSFMLNGNFKVELVWLMFAVISATISLGRDIKEVFHDVIRRLLIIGGIGIFISLVACMINIFLLVTHRGGIEFFDLLPILGSAILFFTIVITFALIFFETLIIVFMTLPNSSTLKEEE